MMDIDDEIHIFIDNPLRDFFDPVNPCRIDPVVDSGNMVMPADRDPDCVETGFFDGVYQFLRCFRMTLY